MAKAKTTRSRSAPKPTDAKQNAAKQVAGSNVSEAKLKEARLEGVIEAEKEAAKGAYEYATDGQLPGDPPSGPRWPGKSEIMQYSHLIGLDVEAFEEAVSEEAETTIAEDKVAGLLELERSGQNRTPYVQACMKRLKVDSPYEVTAAGPAYTNDVRPVSKL